MNSLLLAYTTTVVAGPSLTAIIGLVIAGLVLLAVFLVVKKFLMPDGQILNIIAAILCLLFLCWALHTFGIF